MGERRLEKFFESGHSVRFWGFVSLLFLLSTLGLLTSLASGTQHQSLQSSAYSPGSTNIIDMNHYIQKFGFYRPTQTYKVPSSDFARLKSMVPFASKAADAFNQSFGTSVEPELIVWWSYAEGINGRTNFSNCNDRIYTVSNCYYPVSWQLGYGIQFTAIGLLKKAFTDMHGNPNDANLVQKIGQSVLITDSALNSSPHCGGYSCTFPHMTVDQIMSGVSTSHETQNNWWASVLSRDPAINAYINAEALQLSRFNRQKAWGWGTYYQTHWQEYSNDLQTILSNWIALGGCTALSNCYIGKPTSTPTPSPTPNPTDVALVYTPTPTLTPLPTKPITPTATPKPSPAPTSMPTATPTLPDTPTPTGSLDEADFMLYPTDTIPTDITPTEDQTETTPTPEEVTPTPTGAGLPIITFAPIAAIPTHPIVYAPTPVQKQLIAGKRTSPVLGLLSVMGLIFTLLLVIPITRHKIFFLWGTFFHKVTQEEDEEEVDNDIDKVFDIKVVNQKTDNASAHLKLTDETGTVDGYSSEENLPEGFARVQGTRKQKGKVVYIDIHSLQKVEHST